MSPFLALLVGGTIWSPVDLASPDAVMVIQARLSTLGKGMTPHDASKWLGLEGQTPEFLGGTATSHTVIYRVGQTHELFLWFGNQQDSWILTSATLEPRWLRLPDPGGTWLRPFCNPTNKLCIDVR
jgi:hypothetical protein